jgi:hypothetical protein
VLGKQAQAIAVSPENLDSISRTTAEHRQVSGEGILGEL